MKARDVMTANPVTVEPDTSVTEAVRLMLQHKFSGLPVIDQNGTLVGIVTEGDLLRRAETGTQRQRWRFIQFLLGPGRMATEYAHARGRKVNEVMTETVQTISEDTPLEDAVKIMEQHRIKRLPVIRDGRIVGIISRANLIRALASIAGETKPTAVADSKIRELLTKELAGQSWAPATLIDVVVRNGVVHLWGTIFDERQRKGIRVAAENTPGVNAVEDHLVWIEPMSGTVIGSDEEPPTAPM